MTKQEILAFLARKRNYVSPDEVWLQLERKLDRRSVQLLLSEFFHRPLDDEQTKLGSVISFERPLKERLEVLCRNLTVKLV